MTVNQTLWYNRVGSREGRNERMRCPNCGAEMVKNGTKMRRTGLKQQWLCPACGVNKTAEFKAEE